MAKKVEATGSVVKNMKPATKAAAVLIALGADNAAEVYKHLKDTEIEDLSYEITKIEKLSSEDMQDIMSEFYELLVAQKVISEGGVDYAREVLIKAFGNGRASELMESLTKATKVRSFEFLKKVDYKTLLMVLQYEHPQAIALVLSYVKPEVASKILAELPQKAQVEVFHRIANIDRTSPEIINLIEEVLVKKLSAMSSVDMVEVGGVNYLAEVMNNIESTTGKYIFDELGESNPDLVNEIKKRMFVFEDIVYLDNMEIQIFIRECDTKDLTVALKGSTEEIQNTVFSNMSQRQQETIKTDMQYLHNVRLRDVEEAQTRIIAIIRRLEEQGDIVLSKGGNDAVIA
ncbi:MAG: flagellar motor switch protein FliG [Ruminococcus sp.]|jgi:flagellar motor switch protein FliG|nr:flagellar motor switch protein FliG [Ruminococcus sp.]